MHLLPSAAVGGQPCLDQCDETCKGIQLDAFIVVVKSGDFRIDHIVIHSER